MEFRVILMFLSFIVCTISSPMPRISGSHKYRFCGSRLSDALSLICAGKYNSPPSKKDYDLFNYDSTDGFQEDANADLLQVGYPFIYKESANALQPMNFHKRNGIVEECCFKPCNIQQLRQYCA